MKERELQEQVQRLIQEGRFPKAIANRAQIEKSYASACNAQMLPAFPIDYLLRKRSLESAARILSALSDLELVAATRNISPDRTGLLPDLIALDRHTQTTLVFELKTNNTTERQAATELLAYDHEIRNHFPFSSHAEMCLVVVATEFGTLLDHAVAGLLLWQGRDILCLRVVPRECEPRLEVHLPHAWTSMGQLGLPEEAVQTATLAVHPLEQERPLEEPAYTPAVAALVFELLVRDAERAGSHGFVVYWVSSYGEALGLFTIATVNPRALLSRALRKGFLKDQSDALTKWFADAADKLPESPPSLARVAERAREYLARSSRPSFEGLRSWQEAWKQMRDGGAVLRVEFWGLLGEFARDQFLHPFLEGERRGERGAGESWRNPDFAIPLINELCGAPLFRQGRFGALDVFRFGCQLMELITTCETIARRGSEELLNLPALMQWLSLEILPAIRAIIVRYKSSDLKPPPRILLGDNARARETADALDELGRWFLNEFLKHNPLHQRLFNVASQIFPLFSDFAQGLDDDQRAHVTLATCDEVVGVTESALAQLKNFVPDASQFRQLDGQLRHLCGSPENATDDDTVRTLKSLLGREPARAPVMLTALLELLDQAMPSVAHRLGAATHVGIDWEWIRSQVEESRQRGNPHAGVMICEDGTIATSTFQELSQLRVPPTETEVVLGIAHTFGTEYLVMSWNDLASGAWSEKVATNSSPADGTDCAASEPTAPNQDG